MPIPNNTAQIRERALIAFSEIKLDYFEANPSSAVPFESNTLRWKVNKPQGIRYTINGLSVQPEASRQRVLSQTTTFKLIAHFSVYTHVVASVTVIVHLNACVNVSTGFSINDILASSLKSGIEDNDEFEGFYFPEGWEPVVKITSNNVYFKAQFKKSVSYFPDPTVTLAANFNIGVRLINDPLVINRFSAEPAANIVSNNANVTVPWWAWSIPGAVPALIIVLGSAKDKAIEQSVSICQSLAEGVVDLIRFFNGSQIPPSHKLHKVTLYEEQGGGGLADGRFCPPPDLPVFSGEFA